MKVIQFFSFHNVAESIFVRHFLPSFLIFIMLTSFIDGGVFLWCFYCIKSLQQTFFKICSMVSKTRYTKVQKSKYLHPTYTLKKSPVSKISAQIHYFRSHIFASIPLIRHFDIEKKKWDADSFFSWKQLAVEYQEASPSLYSSCKLMQKMQVAA